MFRLSVFVNAVFGIHFRVPVESIRSDASTTVFADAAKMRDWPAGIAGANAAGILPNVYVVPALNDADDDRIKPSNQARPFCATT